MVASLTPVFGEGFDAIVSPQGARKWTNGASIITSTSNTRFNTGRYFAGGSGSHQLPTSYRAGQLDAAVRWQIPANTAWFQVLDSTGAAQLTLRFIGGNVMELRRGTATGTILATSTLPRALTIWDFVEFGWLIDTGVAGAYRIVVNGLLDISSAGANTQATALNTWSGWACDGTIAGFDDFMIKAGATVYDNTLDFWGDRRCSTLFANGVGDTTQWLIVAGTGANWQQVDETSADDDTTCVGTDVVGALDLYQFDDLMAGATDIRCVILNTVSKRENSGTPPTRTMQQQIRSNGVDSLSAARTLASTYSTPFHLLTLDPSGAVQFTRARVNAIQGGQLLSA